MAHIELAKAELSAIGGEIARAAALGGIAIAVVLLAGILFVVGMALFTSEWLLGSMGWGILHGVLLFAGIATACGLSIVGVSGGRIGRWLALAVVIGILVSIVFALDLPNQLYTAIGDNFVTSIEPGVRPLVVGLVLWGVIGLLVGVGLAFRLTSAGSRFGAIVGLALAGAAFGAFTSIMFSVQVGVGIGAAVGWARGPCSWPPTSRGRAWTSRRSRPASPRPGPSRPARRRSSGYRQDAARDRVLAARADVDEQLQVLEASTRAALDIKAKIRRNPANAAAVAGGVGFLALRGPQRVVRGTRRAIFGQPKPMPKSILPEEVDKTLRELGEDGEKVRGILERDFALYAKKASKERLRLRTVLTVAIARPLCSRSPSAPCRRCSRRRPATSRPAWPRSGRAERGIDQLVDPSLRQGEPAAAPDGAPRRSLTGPRGDTARRPAAVADAGPLDSRHGRVAEWQTRRP